MHPMLHDQIAQLHRERLLEQRAPRHVVHHRARKTAGAWMIRIGRRLRGEAPAQVRPAC